jgi:hypothetical protein
MGSQPEQTPLGWGNDDLSAFLNQARRNQLASFHKMRTAFELMKEVDACFMKVGTNLLNPKDALTPVFLFRSHSGFRAARATAMAVQSVETYVLLRSCLECAVYGLFISKVKGMNKVWLNRNENVDAKKRARARVPVGEHSVGDRGLRQAFAGDLPIPLRALHRSG